MMTGHDERLNGHEKFRELCALANSGILSARESAELEAHLRVCDECREAYHQYHVLATEGIPALAARYSNLQGWEGWDDTVVRRKLFARVRKEKHQGASEQAGHSQAAIQADLLRRILAKPLPLAGAALAACLVIAVGFIAYRAGSRAQAGAKQAQASAEQAQAFAENRYQKLVGEKQSADELLGAQTKKISQLQRQISQKEQELAKLGAASRAQENRAEKLAAAGSATNAQLQGVAQERDALKGRLRVAERAYQSTMAEISSLRTKRSDALLRSASLESRIEELSVRNRDEEDRLRDDEQSLSADRDIRDLMGARNLYIADVFDVDSSSRTQKPFGRIFYTEGQSLIFYAFDLDRQAHLKNVSAFQAWGLRETGQREPLNLGIFYMDNKSNRRWVLRFDDPKKLAEINAVFVTVEPHGGSRKPTSKPFLYALLRKAANHP